MNDWQGYDGPKVTDYEIIDSADKGGRNSDPSILAYKVREMMKDGWIPLGGVCFGEGMFWQALIREEE